MCDNEGGFSDRAVKEAYGHAQVHEGWLLVVKIAQDVKGHEKIETFVSFGCTV